MYADACLEIEETKRFSSLPGPAHRMRCKRQPPGDFAITVPSDWRGARGASLTGEEIKLHFAGNPDGPAVFVLGGVSANRFVADDEQSRGWWSEVAAPGGGINLNEFCVIGADFIPTGAAQWPELTPADFATLYHEALKRAGVHRLHAFVGASFGGMIGLAFARLFPNALDRLVVLCAAHKPSPMAQAWRHIQRRIVEFATDCGRPAEGVALARQVGMTTYRTPEEFNGRFDHRPDSPDSVGAYLDARGTAYAAQCAAQKYLTLSAAIDFHDETPEAISTPCLLIAAETDRLAPLSDLTELHERLGGRSQLTVISSIYGHDAFLKETADINPHLNTFLKLG